MPKFETRALSDILYLLVLHATDYRVVDYDYSKKEEIYTHIKSANY